MLTAEAASLVLSIASGVIKIVKRSDRLLAEREAVLGPLALPMPSVSGLPSAAKMKRDLKRLLSTTNEESPDPLGDDRDEIGTLLDQAGLTREEMLPYYKKYDPVGAQRPDISPDSELIVALGKARPDLDLNDEEVRLAAFYIAPGEDDRELGYEWRLALLVVDVVAEFGADNTALFVRDETARELITSVLRRFAKPELEDFTSSRLLVRHALSATFNGLLDARGAIAGDKEWASAILGALAAAREQAEDGDNYLLGLLQGTGYKRLISALMSETVSRLRLEDARAYELIAADVLAVAAGLVQSSRSFEVFFTEHWGDLLHAGLVSLEKHGPALLADEEPILRVTLLAITKQLANTPYANLLTKDTLFGLADAVIGAIAADPDLVTDGIDEDWLKLIIASATKTISNKGIRATFSPAGIEAIMRDALAVLGTNPQVLIDEPGLLQKVVGGVLKSLSGVPALDAESIASAATSGALEAIASNPQLLGTKYPEVIASLAGEVGSLVREKKLSRIQGADLMHAAARAVLANPQLFVDMERKLASEVVGAVLGAADGDQARLVAGSVLVDLVRKSLEAAAIVGVTLLDNHPIAGLAEKLTAVLSSGLARAQVELGRRLDLNTLPTVLSMLIEAWARGEIATIDPDDPNFKRLFAELADKAALASR